MGRWKEFMEQGPDRLSTCESEDYEADSADEALIAIEISLIEEAKINESALKLLLPQGEKK